MAYGPFQANVIQLGRESTAGTAVAATKKWRGKFAMLEDARTRVIVDEQVGLLITAERSYDAQYLGRASFPATELTAEQVCDILEAGIQTVSPSGSGPYVYSYALPTGTTVNTIKPYTIEAGNSMISNSDVREMQYSMVEEFEFSADAGQAWNMSANWIGRQLSDSTLTGALSLVTVNELTLPQTSLYIDASGGTIGTTQKTGVLMGARMTVRTGVTPVMVGDGNLYFATHKFVKPEVTFSLTLELESGGVADAQRASFENNTVQLFRLDITKSASAKMVLDWAGKYDSSPVYSDNNGNTTVTIEGHAVYSSTDTLFWECEVTNGLASL